MNIELIPKRKILADNYIIIFLCVSYLLFIIFFRLEALIGLTVYPFTSLAVFGVLRIINGLNKKFNYGHLNLNKILVGIIFIIFSVLYFVFILSSSRITTQIIISLITLPMMNVGFAGIIKGLIVNIYSTIHRLINSIIGIITVIICLLIFTSIMDNFLFSIVILSLTLIITILSRAALYLSEYGLSLLHLKNFVFFFYIISDYLLYVGKDGDVLLVKIE